MFDIKHEIHRALSRTDANDLLKAQAENKRLRAALKEILQLRGYHYLHDAWRIAKAALRYDR